jgi:hypothetical protein
LFKAYALANSIAPFKGVLNILVIDELNFLTNKPENINIFSLTDLNDYIGNQIIDKYQSNQDKLRWALKPVFLKHLLNETNAVIYVDNDIYFYNDFSFLFQELETNNILLTPHFYKSNPHNDQNWLEANFRVGLYNAGFIGVNQQAILALNWWANCCLYNVKKVFWRGLFDDQKYLDLFPILFDKVKIIKDKGCNLAGWNYLNYQFERNSYGDLIIDDTNKLIFIHFAESSLVDFSETNHSLNKEYKVYEKNLMNHHAVFYYKRSIFNKRTIYPFIYFLVWKLFRKIEIMKGKQNAF